MTNAIAYLRDIVIMRGLAIAIPRHDDRVFEYRAIEFEFPTFIIVRHTRQDADHGDHLSHEGQIQHEIRLAIWYIHCTRGSSRGSDENGLAFAQRDHEDVRRRFLGIECHAVFVESQDCAEDVLMELVEKRHRRRVDHQRRARTH